MTILAEQSWRGAIDQLPDLSDMDAQKWMDLVEQRTGVMITLERKSFLMTGLRSQIREAGLADYDSYFQLLASTHSWSPEWSGLIHRLTVHETSFFRHEPSLRLLEENILPAFVERNRECGREFRVWSVGCATGEEPYSLAMLIHRYLGGVCKGHGFGITATDISEVSLEEAQAGVYSARRSAGVPRELLGRYCRDLGDDRYQIVKSLRQRVTFTPLNVMDIATFSLNQLDLIFCQNMLIYFSRERRLQILKALAERLEPGGVLLLGPGDVPSWSHPEFERIRFEGILAFRRQAQARASV